MDPKSLTTMSNAKGVGGCQTLLTNFVSKTLSPMINALSKCFPFGQSCPWTSAISVADGLVNFDG
jgi:hypothetical protein